MLPEKVQKISKWSYDIRQAVLTESACRLKEYRSCENIMKNRIGCSYCMPKNFDMLYKLACRQLHQRIGSVSHAADMVQSVFLIAARMWKML